MKTGSAESDEPLCGGLDVRAAVRQLRAEWESEVFGGRLLLEQASHARDVEDQARAKRVRVGLTIESSAASAACQPGVPGREDARNSIPRGIAPAPGLPSDTTVDGA